MCTNRPNSDVLALLIADDVAVCLRHNHNYARDLRQTLPFVKQLLTVKYMNMFTLLLRHSMYENINLCKCLLMSHK